MVTVHIKPHHFMDIIKLHGAGIEEFVPDINMGHDFYKVANKIMRDPSLKLILTVEGDDICLPCKKYKNCCQDQISHIPGFKSKDDYNKLLDRRIIELYHLQEEYYEARSLCALYYESSELIYEIWKEETAEAVDKRYALFVKGAEAYLNKFHF